MVLMAHQGVGKSKISNTKIHIIYLVITNNHHSICYSFSTTQTRDINTIYVDCVDTKLNK